MGDMAEVFSGMREASKTKRDNNRVQSTSYLKNKGIPFMSNNGGVHLILKIANKQINFWPGTGLWHVLDEDSRIVEKGRGVKKVVDKYLKLKGST